MFQNDRFIHLFKWNGADEVLTTTYTNHSDGEWHGLVWPGGATQVIDKTNCTEQQPHGN